MKNHPILNFLTFVILTISLFSCEKLVFSEELNYPITTITLLDSLGGQFVVQGEVIAPSSNTIESVFVNWYLPGKSLYQELPRYMIPADYTPDSPFTVTIDRDIISEREYQIRFVYQLASGERMFSRVLSASTAFSEPSPMQEVSSFSRLLAETTDDFKVVDGELILIADNARYPFNGTNFLATNGIPNGDISVQVLFQNSGNVKFLVEIEGRTLYAKAIAPGNWEIWEHLDGSSSVTLLGVIPMPSMPSNLFAAGNRVFFTQSDFSLWEIIFAPEFRIESIDDIPLSNTLPIRDQYFAATEEALFVLTKSNASVLGTIPSTLQLLRYDLSSNSWEELPAPPGSSDGYLWMSAEPERLLFGGEITGAVEENDVWLLDFSNNAPWEFIGWLPSESILLPHKPRFVDGRHQYIGINTRFFRDPAFLFTIDLDQLEEL